MLLEPHKRELRSLNWSLEQSFQAWASTAHLGQLKRCLSRIGFIPLRMPGSQYLRTCTLEDVLFSRVSRDTVYQPGKQQPIVWSWWGGSHPWMPGIGVHGLCTNMIETQGMQMSRRWSRVKGSDLAWWGSNPFRSWISSVLRYLLIERIHIYLGVWWNTTSVYRDHSLRRVNATELHRVFTRMLHRVVSCHRWLLKLQTKRLVKFPAIQRLADSLLRPRYLVQKI